MESPTTDLSRQEVFWGEIKEHRGDYYVIYQPADVGMNFANLWVIFPGATPATAVAMRTMEHELNGWLKRFPVPVMVSALDAKEDLIPLSDEFGRSHLMGYADSKTGQIVRRWGLFKDAELPREQLAAEYLSRVYEGVPFRMREEVRQKAELKTRATVRAARLIVFFMVVVPVLIEIISLGVTWLGHLLSVASISAGAYKAAKAMGWLKPSKRQKQEAERDLKMRHYYYHCERNPDAFAKLRNENFEREAVERTRKEEEALRVTR